MSDLSIESFYPNYKEISDKDFYNSIFYKKEFNENILEKYEKFPEKPGDLMNHQKIVKYFLSSHTPYNNLLLYHMPGSGKTCTTIGVIEQIKKEAKMKGALIFASGKNLLNNYLFELVYKCTDGRYIPENEENISEIEKIHKIQKLTSYYQFFTFETFANYLGEITDQSIQLKFSNHIIVIDEAHNLRNTEEFSPTIYNQFFRFLHTVKNVKILLLTGTPVKDHPKEIASLMNLILPMEKQLPVEDIFKEVYLIEKNGIISFNPRYYSTFLNSIKGYVSYVENMKSDIPQIFSGNFKLNQFVLDTDEMSEFQTRIYLQALANDKNIKNIYSNSRQAILFVFPDSTFGFDGFKNNIKKELVKWTDKKEEKVYNFFFTPPIFAYFNLKTIEEKLEKVYQCSSKYAKTIQNILKAKEAGKNVFVYCGFVNGSGLIVFSILLSLFGYSKATGKETTKEKRFAILSNTTTTTKQIKTIINRFNQDDNANGDYIQVIIGSKIINEGISFYNIQEEEILTPHWNFSETQQAIARGFRLNSHKALVEKNPTKKITVNVHLRTSLLNSLFPKNENFFSIDQKMYEISEKKEYGIQEMKKLLRNSAVDCALNYKRNFNGEDYTCFEFNAKENKIDDSSYNLFFYQEEKLKVIEIIRNIFSTFFSLEFVVLKEKINNLLKKEITEKLLMIILQEIIEQNVSIINFYGFMNFLRESNNIYYLVEKIGVNNNFFSSYYTENINLTPKKSFLDVVKEKQIVNQKELLHFVNNSTNFELIQNLLSKFSFDVQESFLEKIILKKIINSNLSETENKIFLYYENFFKTFVIVFDQKKNFEKTAWISWLNPDKIRVLFVNKYLDNNTFYHEEWENASDDMIEIYKNFKKGINENDNLKKYGFFGQYSKATDEFCIKNVDMGKGRRCLNWALDDLLRIIIFHLKIDLKKFNLSGFIEKYKDFSEEELEIQIRNDDLLNIIFENSKIYSKDEMLSGLFFINKKIKDLCSIIRDDMESKNILIEDASCGQQKKRKELI